MISNRLSLPVAAALGDVLMSVSIGLIPAWPDLMGHAEALSSQADAAGTLFGNAHYCLLIGMIIGGLTLAALPRLVTRHQEPTALFAGIVGAASTMAFALGAPMVASLATIVCGVCLIWIYGVAFYPLALKKSMSEIGWICTAALVLKALSLHLIDLLPDAAAIGVVICAPAISAGIAAGFFHLSGPYTQQRQEENIVTASAKNSRSATRVSITALIVVSCVAYALMRCGSNFSLWGSQNYVIDLGIAALVWETLAFVIVCYATFVRAPGDLILRFLPSIIVQVVLFGILWCGLGWQLGLTEELGLPILSEFGELYGHMYMFMVMFLALTLLGEQGVRVHGMQWALSAGCVFITLALGLDHAGIQQFVPFSIVNAALVIVLILVHVSYGRDQVSALVSAALAASPKQHGPEHVSKTKESEGEELLDAMASVLNGIAERYLLSDREREVLSLMVQGRTRDGIGERIGLAPGTVSTYIARIYRKMRVHTRQELVGLVYKEISSQGKDSNDEIAP